MRWNIFAVVLGAAAAFIAIANAQSLVNETMTAKVTQVLNGRMPDWQNLAYSEPQPLACYPAQDGQRVRCAARIVENSNEAAEDYLQIYIAEDNGEFDRARVSVDAIAQKQILSPRMTARFRFK